MRKLSLGISVTACLLGTIGTAHAQWAVVDAANLLQNTLTAAKAVQTVANTYTQIERLKDQINNQLQTLKGLDIKSFSDLKQAIAQSQMSYDVLRGDIQSINYNVSDVNRNFNQVFPKDQKQWKSVRYADFDGYYDRWGGEITSSSLAASRAQASIATLDRNNEAIATILANANTSNTGEVRQLQLINQQLALIHTELVTVVQNLATTGRVLSNWAAASVGEKMLNREAASRRLDNYTSRGKPSRRLQQLP